MSTIFHHNCRVRGIAHAALPSIIAMSNQKDRLPITVKPFPRGEGGPEGVG